MSLDSNSLAVSLQDLLHRFSTSTVLQHLAGELRASAPEMALAIDLAAAVIEGMEARRARLL